MTLCSPSARLGLRLIVDIVPNHSSSAHPWFVEAMAAPAGAPARARYMFREGTGTNGELPPNDWQSVFGGPAWTRVPDGQWYLHLFDSSQPDLNWLNVEVRAEFESILRFWLDRGVDGFRIDVAHGMIKADGLPDVGELDQSGLIGTARTALLRPGRRARDLPGMAEDPRQLPRRPGRGRRGVDLRTGAHCPLRRSRTSCTRPSTSTTCRPRGRPPDLRKVIDASLAASDQVGAPPPGCCPTTMCSGTCHPVRRRRGRTPARARAAALLMLALPGSCYVYQGEELGLPEVLDLPPEARQDPQWFRSGGTEPSRDGCRVPIPWSGWPRPSVSARPALRLGCPAEAWRADRGAPPTDLDPVALPRGLASTQGHLSSRFWQPTSLDGHP